MVQCPYCGKWEEGVWPDDHPLEVRCDRCNRRYYAFDATIIQAVSVKSEDYHKRGRPKRI